MENMINRILEMDKKARDMQAQAEESRAQSILEIEDRKKELYNQYDESLKEIIEMTNVQQQETLLEGKKQQDMQTDDLLQVMNQTYDTQKDAWIEKITKAIIQN